ncbi:hypothetical protein HY995_03060 [Candidatus Micrarchaeota archaeon]|nr:hypothetical protein [Candidatus Micrarchaeota archaeon]
MDDRILRNWETVFSDVDCVRVLLYLAKYNPDTQLQGILDKLKLPKEKVEAAINKLISAQMVELKDTSFTLRKPALIAVDNFIELTALTA